MSDYSFEIGCRDCSWRKIIQPSPHTDVADAMIRALSTQEMCPQCNRESIFIMCQELGVAANQEVMRYGS